MFKELILYRSFVNYNKKYILLFSKKKKCKILFLKKKMRNDYLYG